MQKVHCNFKKYQLIVNIKFQEYFMFSNTISPFLYSTCSLSVIKIILDFEGGPPVFNKNFTYFYLLYF